MKSNFYIIAIGGSAGSSQSITELFQYLPGNIGGTFVILQHIHRTAVNCFGITMKQTALKLITAEDDMVIKSGCIYVLPAGKILTIEKDRFHLRDRTYNEIINQSIDLFFDSLAVLQHRAIGIILSGMGSDGAQGLDNIHSQGGISIAQRPETALYKDMPKKAIATHSVQFTRSIKEIAELIVEILKPGVTPSEKV